MTLLVVVTPCTVALCVLLLHDVAASVTDRARAVTTSPVCPLTVLTDDSPTLNITFLSPHKLSAGLLSHALCFVVFPVSAKDINVLNSSLNCPLLLTRNNKDANPNRPLQPQSCLKPGGILFLHRIYRHWHCPPLCRAPKCAVRFLLRTLMSLALI